MSESECAYIRFMFSANPAEVDEGRSSIIKSYSSRVIALEEVRNLA